MAFTLKLITTNGGEFDFTSEDHDYDAPLITRTVEFVRASDQGPIMRRKFVITLSGFFRGNNHHEVVEKYQLLIAALADSTARLIYNDGVDEIIDNEYVYIDGYNEPEDWKQYDGRFAINLHYFEKTDSNNDFNMTARYSSQSGVFNFTPVPHWSRQLAPTRGDSNQNRTSKAGSLIASQGTIVLRGQFQGDNEGEIYQQIEDLRNALKRDGTLTYGSLIVPVYAGVLSMPEHFPHNYCEYTVTFKYYTNTFYSLSMKRGFSRLHRNPKITELLYCNEIMVQERSQSGQTVSYDIEIESDTIFNARQLLAAEVEAVLIPGGVELPGGTETWEDNRIAVSLSFKRYHKTPVLSNIGGLGGLSEAYDPGFDFF